MTTDLDALAALHEAATPGPWRFWNDGVVGFPVDADGTGLGKGLLPAHGSKDDYAQQVHDAALIAAARNALPELIERVREAEASKDRWRLRAKSAQNELCDVRTTIGLNDVELWTEADSLSVYRARAETSEARVRGLTVQWETARANLEACNQRANAAEFRVAHLEAGIETLADEWEQLCPHADYGVWSSGKECADSLRALLTPTDKDGE